jgi:hypothetical protein
MRRLTRLSLSIVFLLALCPASARAIPIVTWDLANATGQQVDVLSTAVNVTASVIDEVGVTEWGSTAQDGFVAARGWANSPTTYDPTRYYQFSISADPGFEITYQTLDIALFRGINGGGHGAQMWDLHASTDGFSVVDLDLGTFDISASGVDEQTPFLGHDVSAIGTQAGTVTFRLYGYDYTSVADYSGFGNDDGTWAISGTGVDPVVGGTVTAAGSGVPEPAALWLAGSGLFGMLILGRPRRR